MIVKDWLSRLFGSPKCQPDDSPLREHVLTRQAQQEREIALLEAQASAVTGRPRLRPRKRRA